MEKLLATFMKKFLQKTPVNDNFNINTCFVWGIRGYAPNK